MMTEQERIRKDRIFKHYRGIQRELATLCGKDPGKLTEADKRRIDELEREFEELSKYPEPETPIRERSDGLEPERRGGELTTRKYGELCARSGVSCDFGEFRDAAEYFSVLLSGRHDPRLNRRVNQTLVDADGGFAVPTALAERIFDVALESEVVRPRARVFPMTTQTLRLPVWSGFNHQTNLYGGFTSQWIAEGGSFSVETPQLEQVALTPKKLGLMARVTSELGDDSPMFADELIAALSNAARFNLDDAFLNGAGGAEPEGILNSNALVSVAKETGQAAATILYDNIVKMWGRLLPGSHANAHWAVNPECLPPLMQTSVAVGTGGSHVPVISESPSGELRMMGRPVVVTEKLPALGTVGDILLADFRYFAVGMRADVRIDASPHVGFSTDEIYVRLKLRADGRSILSDAITPRKGASTLSPFVALATRS